MGGTPSRRYPTDLTDAQWAIIEPLFPKRAGPGRPRELELREVINAILYLTRTGCQWRMLPQDFGPWPTVHHYYRQFRLDGTFQQVHDALREKVRQQAGKEPTPSAADRSGRSCCMIWSCSVLVPVEITTRLPDRMAGTR